MSVSVELLAPAKNVETARVAIQHGADAVYIGAPKFSARQAAGNSLTDIDQLCKYAHRYGVRILVALNTILTDEELEQAQAMICRLYESGVDALIVQDMGLLQVDLPPIRLHASTQCDNRTVEHILKLQKAGFSRVVLARELSLTQIKQIREQTSIELEAFVHGALCVSYSGQCYLSCALTGRSANRGQCAQMCRMAYDLSDASGRILQRQKYLLSLKDMDRSSSLRDLIDAGVSSLKIEGRLKDVDYVKNVVTYYRKRLDAIMEGNADYQPSSWGRTVSFFTPDPAKTFHRSSTDYFLHGRTQGLINMTTPKSTGELIGPVVAKDSRSLVIDSSVQLNNGDGLIFGNEGFRINRVEHNRVFPAQMPDVEIGTVVSRNHDQEYARLLQRKTAERLLPLILVFDELTDGFRLTATEPNSGRSASATVQMDKIPARMPQQAMETVHTQLSKLGNTGYELLRLEVHTTQAWFLPNAQLNELRRQALAALDRQPLPDRIYEAVERHVQDFQVSKTIDYRFNVHNRQAVAFYKSHGAQEVRSSYERSRNPETRLMTCKYCLRHELGWCLKQAADDSPKDPLYLRLGETKLRLHFDCRNCEMYITQEE